MQRVRPLPAPAAARAAAAAAARVAISVLLVSLVTLAAGAGDDDILYNITGTVIIVFWFKVKGCGVLVCVSEGFGKRIRIAGRPRPGSAGSVFCL